MYHLVCLLAYAPDRILRMQPFACMTPTHSITTWQPATWCLHDWPDLSPFANIEGDSTTWDKRSSSFMRVGQSAVVRSKVELQVVRENPT